MCKLGSLLMEGKMGRSFKIVSVLDGFITLAGGSRPSCCGARIHSVLTVICSLMGYFQGLNKCYEDLMHSIFTAGEVAF